MGLDNVDLAACARRGVVVTHTPDVLTGRVVVMGDMLQAALGACCFQWTPAIRTMDGQEIFCPAVDIDGSISYGHREGDRDVQDPATMMATMKAQMQRMQEQMDAMNGNNPDLVNDVGRDQPRY